MGKKRNKKKQPRVVQERLEEQLLEENEEEKDVVSESVLAVKEPEPQESIKNALYEDYENVTGDTDEEFIEEEISEEIVEEKKERPNKFYLVFAIFIIVMSIIGIMTTIQFGVNTVNEIVNQTALKNEIALFLYPVVTVDPPEFSETNKIPTSVVIESAIWRIILMGENGNYEKLYNTYMYVPAVDVEFAARTLYGSSVQIQHQTVGSTSTAFTYVEASNSYLVPISPRYTAYSPVVTEISSVGELFTVTVDYMPPTALAIEGIKLQNTTTKTMVYTLSKSRDNMTIHSAKNETESGVYYG